MAKKKMEKTETSSGDAPAKKAPAKKAAGGASKAPAAKAASGKQTKSAKPAAAPAGTPMIDTALAASAAAAMLVGRKRRDATEGTGSLIQQLKADLNKGHAANVSGMLDKGAPSGQTKTGNQPFGQKQVGHNQTFGPDVARSGVPRRTSG